MTERKIGFTLFELLLIAAIIGIIALIVVPMMSSAASIQVRFAADMLASDLEYARSIAISQRRNYSVVFDMNDGSYQIQNDSIGVIEHPVKKGSDYIANPGDERLDKVDIVDVNFNMPDRVTFDYLGAPDSGGDITLQSGKIRLRVVVEESTGFIRVIQ